MVLDEKKCVKWRNKRHCKGSIKDLKSDDLGMSPQSRLGVDDWGQDVVNWNAGGMENGRFQRV